jgi:O-antigen/teichoic acid export membrane protein
MTSLKQKTISALSWSFAGNFAVQAIAFVIGIILARLLSPREYGLIGMVTIFIVLTQPFISSGFGLALIRKKECTDTEFSTVFYFNLITGIFFYGIIFWAAPYISSFFNEPELTKITRVIGLIILIDAVTIIQTTILTKDVNFKLQTKIGISSSVVSGILGIVLAYKGFGVWSLVYKTMAQQLIRSGLHWFNSRWKPQQKFSFTVLKELFGFSSKLLASDILDKFYYNIYNLVIAKYFSARELGLYTRAKMFNDLIAQNLSEMVGSVAFPVLASIQDEPERLKESYKKIFTGVNFIVWIALFILVAVAKPLVITLIGEQWIESVIYLQLLCFVGIFYPVHALTKNILYVYGRSGLFFRLQIFTKALAAPAIIIGVFFGIKYMIMAMIVGGLIEFLVKAYYSGKFVNYSLLNQVKDLVPTFLLAITIGLSLYVISLFLNTEPLLTLLIQLFSGIVLTLGLSELFKLKEYLFIKEVALSQFNKISNRKK